MDKAWNDFLVDNLDLVLAVLDCKGGTDSETEANLEKFCQNDIMRVFEFFSAVNKGQVLCDLTMKQRINSMLLQFVG